MKTRVLLVVAAAAVVATLFSCTRELSIDINTASREMTFTASFSDDGTKTSIQPDGTSVWWAGEESINVFTSSGKSAKFTSTGTEARATAEFTGSFESGTEGDTYYAVYPYDEANSYSDGVITLTVPAQQTAVEGTFADNLFPSIAVSNGNCFQFYHACSGIRFRVSREDIKSIVITAIDYTNIAGGRCFVIDEAGKPKAKGFPTGVGDFHSVTLNAPEDRCLLPNKYYYAVLLPTTHKVSITFCLQDGRTGTFSPDGYGVNFRRAVFRTIDYLDTRVDFMGPQAIDLGLSVKWASCNLGATEPEEYGDYFAWGEVEPKSSYNRSTYSFTWDDIYGYSKYNDNDVRIALYPEDDAATVFWGRHWRMPTEEEFVELIEKCNWTKVSVSDNCVVYNVTSTIEGFTEKSILLPAAGYVEGSTLEEASSTGLYWSSSLYMRSGALISACALHFWRNHIEASYWDRPTGLTIRPVYQD